jgi:sporulation protein YlmC with PRC-barrel domain
MVSEYLSQAFNGKPVVSLADGQIVGRVVDVFVDPEELSVAAIITSKGRMLRRELEGFPSEEVELWGQDVVLVKHSDIIRRGEELPLQEEWLAVSDHLIGHDVVNGEGTRIGRVNDIVIDCVGEIVGYNLAEIFTDSPIVVGGRIAVEFTHSLGQDVLIVDERHGTHAGDGAQLSAPQGPPEAGA